MKAVAIDLGASSARFALGSLEEGAVRYEVIEQVPHEPVLRDGLLVWDLDLLLGLCRRAVAYAASQGASSVGIDTWGVDVGFLDHSGALAAPVVCYRDHSHERAFAEMEAHRERLFRLTGIQHQPFNTLYQLYARGLERPELKGMRFLLLPDLLGYLLGGMGVNELTHASSTQLLGLDGRWSAEAFDIIGWPVPEEQPVRPGFDCGEVAPGVRLLKVGGHDTASAVAGLGTLGLDEAFLNVGTWSLLGRVLDEPLVSEEAMRENFTNERAVDGRVRFLANIPGFYVINRVYEELAPGCSKEDWLASASAVPGHVDLLDAALFNPASMMSALAESAQMRPSSAEEWAGLAMFSLASTVAGRLEALERVTGTAVRAVRASGGGSACEPFVDALREATGRQVIPGPVEATLVGNLAVQLGVAAGKHGA